MPASTANVVARMRLARRYLTEVLINLPINTHETHVDTLVVLMDELAEHPEKYLELLNARTTTDERLRRPRRSASMPRGSSSGLT